MAQTPPMVTGIEISAGGMSSGGAGDDEDASVYGGPHGLHTAAGATAAANGCGATVAAQTAREGSVPAPALGRVSRGAGGRLEGRVAMCVTP